MRFESMSRHLGWNARLTEAAGLVPTVAPVQQRCGGHCCVGRSRRVGERRCRARSDHHSQFGEGVRQASPGWHFGPEVVEAPAEVLDQSVRSDDDPGGAIPLNPRIGRRRALRRPWSVSMGLLA